MSQGAFHLVDSHTEGEPTRVLVSGGPDLGCGPLAGRLERFRRDHDWVRRAICNEPRGHEAIVGALLCEPHDPNWACGVVFFNNVSTLNLCTHGTIGLAATLAHLGRIRPGAHRIDTPAGVVTATLHEDGWVEVANVPSYRLAAEVEVPVPGYGTVRGDIAWGGNWFFLVEGQGPEVRFSNLEGLTAFAWAIRRQLAALGITGANGMEIDHVELFGPPGDHALADSRNFVLCPGKAYDRSPCGTGTSAKLASLHADGKLKPGQVWRQAGILDTVFTGSVVALPDGTVIPRVCGRAWVNGESRCLFHPGDPFRHGMPVIG